MEGRKQSPNSSAFKDFPKEILLRTESRGENCLKDGSRDRDGLGVDFFLQHQESSFLEELGGEIYCMGISQGFKCGGVVVFS